MSIRSNLEIMRTSTDRAELYQATLAFAIGLLTTLMVITALIGGVLVGLITAAILSPWFLIVAIPSVLYALLVPATQKSYRAGEYDHHLKPAVDGLIAAHKK